MRVEVNVSELLKAIENYHSARELGEPPDSEIYLKTLGVIELLPAKEKALLKEYDELLAMYYSFSPSLDDRAITGRLKQIKQLLEVSHES